MSISALIIAKNEEKNLTDCIRCLNFVDQIVVIVDDSKDDTKNIALKFTRFVFDGSWLKEHDRRNFGISKCKNKWIIEIDADERVSKNLALEIMDKINNEDADFYYIPFLNYVCSKPIKYGWMACLAPDGKYNLFKKKNKKWLEGRVHPAYQIEGTKGSKFYNCINHFMSNDISDLINRFNRNTSLYAMDLIEGKKNLNKFLSKRKIISRFLKCFLIRKGFMNPGIGFLISFLSAIYPFTAAIKTKSLN